MEQIEKKVLMHLGRINSGLLVYYVNNIAIAENDIVFSSQRDYEQQFGGSYRSLGRYKQILRHFGLILPLGRCMRMLPVTSSVIGEICMRGLSPKEEQKAVDLLIQGICRNGSEVGQPGSVIGQPGSAAESSVSNGINELAEKSDNRVAKSDIWVAHKTHNNNIKDIKSNKTINNIIDVSATILSYSEEKMACKEQVLQIWESWNSFVSQFATVDKSPITKQLRNGTGTGSSRQLYDCIAQWIEDQGDEWWDNWEFFINKAKKNTWLQSKEGFSVTLHTVFRGTTKDPTPVIIKAMEGKYDGWNLKITNDLDEKGKATETKLAQFAKGSKGMKVFGEVE